MNVTLQKSIHVNGVHDALCQHYPQDKAQLIVEGDNTFIRLSGNVSAELEQAANKLGACLITADKYQIVADGAEVATITVTVANQANGNFDITYFDAAAPNTTFTQTVVLANGVATFQFDATSVGKTIFERIDNNYFARCRVEAV